MTSEGRTEGTDEATTHIGNSNPKSIQLIEAFVGPHADYYVFQFGRISQLGLAGIRLNWAATLGGPFWAATRSLWVIFGFAALGDVIGLIMISRAYWSSSQGNGVLSLGLLFLVAFVPQPASWPTGHTCGPSRAGEAIAIFHMAPVGRQGSPGGHWCSQSIR